MGSPSIEGPDSPVRNSNNSLPPGSTLELSNGAFKNTGFSPDQVNQSLWGWGPRGAQSRLTTTALDYHKLICKTPWKAVHKPDSTKTNPFIIRAHLLLDRRASIGADFLQYFVSNAMNQIFFKKLQQAIVNTAITRHYHMWKSNMWTVIRRLICVFYTPFKNSHSSSPSYPSTPWAPLY